MKRLGRCLCVLVVLSMLVCTFAIAESKKNVFANVDPFGFVQNGGCLGSDINYLLEDLEIDVDYTKEEKEDCIIYSLEDAFYYMDFPEDNACVLFTTKPDSNTIDEITYFFCCSAENSDLLSISAKKIIEEIESLYGEPLIAYFPSVAGEGTVSTKTFMSIGLRNRNRGYYNVDWTGSDMNISFTVFVTGLDTDIGSLSFRSAEPTKTYEINEMGITISIPSMYDVFTCDISDDDPNLDKYGFSASVLRDHYSMFGTYLNAMTDDLSEEIIVTMNDSLLLNFNDLSDQTLEIIAEVMIEEAENNDDIIINQYDIYHHPQLNFIRLYSHFPVDSSYSVQYLTAMNNKTMAFTFKSYDGTLDDIQEKRMLEIVDSIILNN